MNKQILASVLGGVLFVTAGCSTSVTTSTNTNTAPVATSNVNTAPVVTTKYKVGDKVEALWKNKSTFYKGTVVMVNADGTYSINYDDGDKESNVKEENMRTPVVAPVSSTTNSKTAPTTAPKYKAGDKVEALWKGSSFFKGTIALVNADGTYNINYDDGDKESNVKESNIKALSTVIMTYKVGDKVEAQWKGGSAFFKGVIKTANTDGTYAIDYDDGDKETNVKADKIRLLK